MAWTLEEALLQMKQEDVWQASVMNILRDERHKRLHFRYRVGSETDLSVKCDYLGQTKEHGSTALEMVEATKYVFRTFCTKFANAPKCASVEPVFNADLYEHMRNITEAISIDSASNEIAGAHDLSHSTFTLDAFLPSMMYILRDSAHCARRILQRGWASSTYLNDIFGVLCHWPNSLAQIIHHSDDMKLMFRSCC